MGARRRRSTAVGLVVAMLAVATGCEWTQFGAGPGSTRATSATAIRPTNVDELVLDWTGETNASTVSSPAITGGVAYVGSGDGKLYAFDAAGATGCAGTPTACTPLWTAQTGGVVDSSPAVAGGVVFVGSGDGKLYAFDAAGTTGCAGTPRECEPLWTAATGGPVDSSPEVSGGMVRVGSADGTVSAFDAAGSTGCGGSPKQCEPLFSGATGGAIAGSPAVVDGRLYVGSADGKLSVFSADGTTGCTGTPVTCTPLFTAATGGAISGGPAVREGIAYVGSDDGRVHAFSAAGTAGCAGIPKTCNRLWSGYVGGEVTSPAVDRGLVLVGSSNGKVAAFAAVSNPSGCYGFPKECQPVWTATAGGGPASSPAIAGGVAFVGTTDGSLVAYDATGNLGCTTATTAVCAPLWSYETDLSVRSSPAIAGRVVYIGSDDAHLYAFRLPEGEPASLPVVAQPEAIPGSDEITVRWSQPDTELTVIGYQVRSYVDGVAESAVTTDGDAVTTTFDVARDVAHTFTVSAVTYAGTGDESPPSLPETASPAFAPSTYQVNPAHDGHQVEGALAADPEVQWNVDLGGRLSYPVTGDGRVFVTASGNGSGGYGARLYALDQDDGSILWGPVQIGGTYHVAGLAYEDHRVYVQNFSGTLQAFDEATGTRLWSSQMQNQYAFTSPPTAYRGVVYTGGAGSGGRVFAVDGRSGSILWTASVANGDHSSPAVDASGVYVSYVCKVAYRLDPASGTRTWIHQTGCTGGGGRTPVLAGDRLYVRDWITDSAVLDTATGTVVDSLDSTTAPVVADGLLIEQSGGTLRATDIATGAVLWNQVGDGTIVSAPTAIGDVVVAGGSSGAVVAYDRVSGALRWTVDTGEVVAAPDEHNAGNLTGATATADQLFVSAETALVAIG